MLFGSYQFIPLIITYLVSSGKTIFTLIDVYLWGQVVLVKFSCAIQWIMQTKYHAAGMSHIIDDFFFVGPPHSDKSLHDLNSFLLLCNRIGIPIKAEKQLTPPLLLSFTALKSTLIKWTVAYLLTK